MIVTSPYTYDTNILIYSAELSDPNKHRIADMIVDATSYKGHGTPLQCFTEFYFATTRKRLLQPHVAENIIRRTMRMSKVIPANEDDVLQAISTNQQDGVQFFDALLLATAARSGCTTLFSEDFQHGRTYGSITVQNPFLLSDAELATLLA